MGNVEALWRAAAGSHPVPAVLTALQAAGGSGRVTLSGERVAFGLGDITTATLDAVMQRLPTKIDTALAERLHQTLIAGRDSVRWGIEVELGGDAPVLRLAAEADDPSQPIADLAELRAALGGEAAWGPLPEAGDVIGWSVVLNADTSGISPLVSVETTDGAGWLPAALRESLRDLPEVGTLWVSAGGDALSISSRTRLSGADRSACWEAAALPLAAYGRHAWMALSEQPDAVPSAIRLDGRDAVLEILAC